MLTFVLITLKNGDEMPCIKSKNYIYKELLTKTIMLT